MLEDGKNQHGPWRELLYGMWMDSCRVGFGLGAS